MKILLKTQDASPVIHKHTIRVYYSSKWPSFFWPPLATNGWFKFCFSGCQESNTILVVQLNAWFPDFSAPLEYQGSLRALVVQNCISRACLPCRSSVVGNCDRHPNIWKDRFPSDVLHGCNKISNCSTKLTRAKFPTKCIRQSYCYLWLLHRCA